MSAREIAAALGRPIRAGRQWLASCPVPSHGRGKGDRNPSLAIADGHSGLLVRCHAGCDTRDIFAALRSRGLLEEREEGVPRPSRKPAPVCEPVEHIEPDPKALELWRSAEPFTRVYLRNRGITIEPPPSLRFTPALEYKPAAFILPAMLAAVQAGDRRIIAVQATFLTVDAAKKAPLAKARWNYGNLGDGAVRLGPAGDVLGLAEGTETALAAMQLFGVPTWACIGASRMHTVAIPDTVRELHLFADADAAGAAAVEKTVAVHRHRRVIVHTPAQAGADWADVLFQKSQNAERAA